MGWLDLLALQGALKSLLQHHSSKALILQHSAFFIVQLSHPYMTTGKTIALTRRTFVDKVMPLLSELKKAFKQQQRPSAAKNKFKKIIKLCLTDIKKCTLIPQFSSVQSLSRV